MKSTVKKIIRIFSILGLTASLQGCGFLKSARSQAHLGGVGVSSDAIESSGSLNPSALQNLSLPKDSLPTGSEAERRKSAIDFIPQIRSVTFYAAYGDGVKTFVRNPEASAAEFVKELPRIKQAGFNTVWISDHTTWSFMQPKPEAYRSGFVERELALLKYMIAEARKHGLRVMLPINAYGYGHSHVWRDENGVVQTSSPAMEYFLRKKGTEQGERHDLCTWFNDQSHGNVWTYYKHYVADLLRELKPYHDSVYFFVYSEAGSDDLGNRCEMTKNFYQNVKSQIVRRTYGNLPAELNKIDPSIMKTAIIGYHDDHAIADAWVSADNSPLNPASKFDFVSTHGYYDGYDQSPYAGNHVYIDSLGFSDIVARLTKRINRMKASSPGSKVMLGEFGVSSCRLPELDRQISVFKSIRYAIDTNGVGSNMWAWTLAYGSDTTLCQRTSDGYFLTDYLVSGNRPLTPLVKWMSFNPW